MGGRWRWQTPRRQQPSCGAARPKQGEKRSSELYNLPLEIYDLVLCFWSTIIVISSPSCKTPEPRWITCGPWTSRATWSTRPPRRCRAGPAACRPSSAGAPMRPGSRWSRGGRTRSPTASRRRSPSATPRAWRSGRPSSRRSAPTTSAWSASRPPSSARSTARSRGSDSARRK